MAIEVAKVELKSVQDASGLENCIREGRFTADEVAAVIGKTEGNGGVNDFTRILADQAFRAVLLRLGTRSEREVKAIPMVWSGGCDGVITPHATVFAANAKTGPQNKDRLVIGTAMSPTILPEDIGRPAMVEKVAEGVRLAMRAAGISNPKDVHYVQTKTPLLTIDSIQDAQQRGNTVACEVHDSMGVSNGTTGLGIAVALGEIAMPKAEQICRDLDLYSSVASCSSGVELDAAQIVLLGNKSGAGGRYRIGHGVMRDALDIDGIYAAIRNAGLDLPERPRAEDLGSRLVNCFMKCEADHRGKLRGRRQIMLDDSDVHHHRHSKAAVGGIAAAAIGDPAVFVSVDAMHQGPHGGGPVIAVVDVGE
ncbi:MAG: ring-opening amidohydrolase [Betaproteobacteria bacterium]|jgi:cyanuric acid amidohydrolase|nr:ring-opening amidohydrolase [Betaproteobacteria bacterium]